MKLPLKPYVTQNTFDMVLGLSAIAIGAWLAATMIGLSFQAGYFSNDEHFYKRSRLDPSKIKEDGNVMSYQFGDTPAKIVDEPFVEPAKKDDNNVAS